MMNDVSNVTVDVRFNTKVVPKSRKEGQKLADRKSVESKKMDQTKVIERFRKTKANSMKSNFTSLIKPKIKFAFKEPQSEITSNDFEFECQNLTNPVSPEEQILLRVYIFCNNS